MMNVDHDLPALIERHGIEHAMMTWARGNAYILQVARKYPRCSAVRQYLAALLRMRRAAVDSTWS